jgi:hypothetical protein
VKGNIGSRQHATSNRQASREGRKEDGNKQQATGRQAVRKGKEERANGRREDRQQAASNKQQAGKPREKKDEWMNSRQVDE